MKSASGGDAMLAQSSLTASGTCIYLEPSRQQLWYLGIGLAQEGCVSTVQERSQADEGDSPAAFAAWGDEERASPWRSQAVGLGH